MYPPTENMESNMGVVEQLAPLNWPVFFLPSTTLSHFVPHFLIPTFFSLMHPEAVCFQSMVK